jgi:hypothetical protein
MSLPTTAFAPADPTDGRKPLEWQSRYTDPIARRWIWIEATYLAILILAAPAAILVLWLEYPQHWFHLSDPKYRTLFLYGLAWIGGTLGGTLFDIKWLYHSVARRIWHMDRRLWRFFTPHISGVLAFAVIALTSSGLVRVFDPHALDSSALVLGLAFLVGYFSDSTAAKLAEIADTIFGANRSTPRKDASPDAPK